jgi:uncharacterized membrane protein YkvA (DUF1232 family)
MRRVDRNLDEIRSRPRHRALGAWLGRPRAIWRLLTRRDAPWLPRIVAALTVLYVVFPLDLIPDAIPIVGWLDDLGVVGIATAYVLTQAARFSNDELQPVALRGR